MTKILLAKWSYLVMQLKLRNNLWRFGSKSTSSCKSEKQKWRNYSEILKQNTLTFKFYFFFFTLYLARGSSTVFEGKIMEKSGHTCTYHSADFISPQVQFSQSSHSTNITNMDNFISSQVENPEFGEVTKILNLYYLWVNKKK